MQMQVMEVSRVAMGASRVTMEVSRGVSLGVKAKGAITTIIIMAKVVRVGNSTSRAVVSKVVVMVAVTRFCKI